MTDLTALTLAEALDGLDSKQFSSVELTAAFNAAIQKARVLNAYVVETPEKALEMAKTSDARRASRAVVSVGNVGMRHRGESFGHSRRIRHTPECMLHAIGCGEIE